MKILKFAFLYLIVVLSINSCTDGNNDTSNPSALDFYQEFNVSYGSDPEQVFDLFLPANRTNQTKVMILIHGGGWISGDKSDMNAFRDYILTQLPDIAIVNINYRLADQNRAPYPMQIDDITSVVEFLRNNMDEYTISDNIGFIGTSAGAHLSLLWSYAFDTQDQVNMVCSIVGPTNFTDPAYLENTNPDVQGLLDLYSDATLTFLEEVSPFHQVTSTAPPTILFYGGMDPLVPTSQGIDMRDKLSELGVTHEFTLYTEEGHGWTGINLIDTSIKLHNFINSHL